MKIELKSLLEFVKNEDYNLVDLRVASTNCGEKLTNLKLGDKGVIQSPNFPNFYPPSKTCIWWLQVSNESSVLFQGRVKFRAFQSPPKTKIKISCDTIETQPCNPDFFDYLLLSPEWNWDKYYMSEL